MQNSSPHLHALAIKLDVNDESQKLINHLKVIAGFPIQKRRYHCTIGFIDNSISLEMIESLNVHLKKKMTKFLKDHPVEFEVGDLGPLFGKILAFSPAPNSSHLKEANQYLFKILKEYKDGKFALNTQTNPAHYTPHMTLWHTHHFEDPRLYHLEKAYQEHLHHVRGKLTLPLTSVSTTLF